MRILGLLALLALPAAAQPAAAPKAGVIRGNFGYLVFRVSPGFKQIYIDREATIGFAERIMVPMGGHRVEVIAPEGYADTSFRVEVKKGEESVRDIRLRNLVSGQLAQIPRSYAASKGRGPGSLWGTLKVSSLTVGVLTGLMALREEQLAAQSKRQYNSATEVGNAEWDYLFDPVSTHIRQRNVMVVVSLVSMAAGVFLWSF